jgi:antitoxin YefM
MKTFSATRARSNLYQIIKSTIKNHIPTRLSSKEGSAVLISEEDYENLVETAELLSVPGLLHSIQKADIEIENNEVVTFSEAFND